MDALVPISEIFASVQGEGVFSGRPSWFVRWAGCPLSCVWCDTAYASWKLEDHEKLSVDQILGRLGTKGPWWVVMTGGEPASFGEKFVALSRALKDKAYQLQLETSATVYVPGVGDLYSHVTLSPKLASSGQAHGFNVEVLRQYLDTCSSCELKLVVDGPEDLREAADKIEDLDPPLDVPVVLQPNGLSEDALGWGRSMAEALSLGTGAFAKAWRRRDLRVLGQWQRIYWNGKRSR